MRIGDIIKGILLLLATPVIVLIAMSVVIFFAWPMFCLGLIVCFLVSFLSTTVAWILFALMILFVLLILLVKSI